MIKNWISERMKERTSLDGAVLIALGLMILFLAPLAKIAAGLAIAYGVWTIWKSEYCLLYTSPSPRDNRVSRMPSSA